MPAISASASIKIEVRKWAVECVLETGLVDGSSIIKEASKLEAYVFSGTETPTAN